MLCTSIRSKLDRWMKRLLGLEDGEVTQAMSRAYIKELRDHINALQHQVKVLRIEADELRKYNLELKADTFGNTWWKTRK